MKINILLCDDDKDFLQRLTEVVTSQPLPPGISACVTKSAHSSAITDRQLSQYQIMFLDIDMDERSGMDIARRVRELHLDTIIIFVTNYPEFSMEGYKRICRFVPVDVQTLTIKITASRTEPTLRLLEVYQ